MKKGIAFLLACFLTLAVWGAMAEPLPLVVPTERFHLTIELPEGARLTQPLPDGTLYEVRLLGHEELSLVLSLAETEEYPTQSGAELTPEDTQHILEELLVDVAEARYATRVLPNGHEVLTLYETGAAEMYFELDLYQGVFVQVTGSLADFSTLDESDIAQVSALMDSLAFESVAE